MGRKEKRMMGKNQGRWEMRHENREREEGQKVKERKG